MTTSESLCAPPITLDVAKEMNQFSKRYWPMSSVVIVLLVLVCTSSGCKRNATIKHAIVTDNFEDQVSFEWFTGESFEGSEPSAWWSFRIGDSGLEEHSVRYALRIQSLEETKFIRGHRKGLALPLEHGKMSHGIMGPRALKESCRLRLDYELYSPEGDLLLKGSVFSQPSTDALRLKSKAKQGSESV